MKILVATPNYEDSFSENVALTLKAMGHEVQSAVRVRHDDYYSLPRMALRTIEARLWGDTPTREDRRVLELAAAFGPRSFFPLPAGFIRWCWRNSRIQWSKAHPLVG